MSFTKLRLHWNMSSCGSGSQARTDYIFMAKLDSVGTIATLLKAVAFSEKVNIFISENGLKFTVEEGKYVQAYVLVQKNLFQEFNLLTEEADFKIPLKELLECLKIFCSDGKSTDNTTVINLPNTSLTLKYKKIGGPFEILLEENGVQTEFKLKTEETDNLMEIEIDPAVCKVTLNAEGFFEAIQEVDRAGPEFVEIMIKKTTKDFLITGKASSGWMMASFPESCTVVEHFECEPETSSAKYRFNILRYSFKAIQIADKLFLKQNADGILSLSFLLTSKGDSFVEFLCIPVSSADEELEMVV